MPCLPIVPSDSQATLNKIEWFKGEKKLIEAEQRQVVIWTPPRNSIAYLPESGALLFRGVTNEDSGEYSCVMTRTATSSSSAAAASGESEVGVVRFYVQGKFHRSPTWPQTAQTQSQAENFNFALVCSERAIVFVWPPLHVARLATTCVADQLESSLSWLRGSCAPESGGGGGHLFAARCAVAEGEAKRNLICGRLSGAAAIVRLLGANHWPARLFGRRRFGAQFFARPNLEAHRVAAGGDSGDFCPAAAADYPITCRRRKGGALISAKGVRAGLR